MSLEETRGYHVVTAVLTDDLLPVGARKAGTQGDEHIRQVSVDGNKPQYVIFSRKSASAFVIYLRLVTLSQPPLEQPQLQQVHEDPFYTMQPALSLLQPIPDQRSLLSLYLAYSNTAFPILPPPNRVFYSDRATECPYPPALLPKIYIAALNHAPRGMYRPSVKNVRGLCQQVLAHDNGKQNYPLTHS